MKNANKLCKVLDLSKIRKYCKNVIDHCEDCGGIIIDDDLVPEDVIVDYSDINIYSAKLTCAKCKRSICSNCGTPIECLWDTVYLCKKCAKKYSKQINRIKRLQRKSEALAEDISDEIEELFNED